MEFEILSHAGLRVTHQGKTLICDPWIVGSCYWRSWWNYPPAVPVEEITKHDSIVIYLTHIHWDHFQGPSLRNFNKNTRIVVPNGNERTAEDLRKMGFKDIVELGFGESYLLAPDFKITSYPFWFMLDSGLVIEADGVTLLNVNDAKFMGLTLKHLIKHHPNPDFVFRSHSSANSGLCFDIIDESEKKADDISHYIRDFANFTQAVKATYAIPFASNQCCLHKDSFKFNQYGQDPQMVADYFEKNKILSPQVKVMVAGDTWSNKKGFDIKPQTFFSDKERHLKEYLKSKSDILEDFYEKEAKSKITLELVDNYFQALFKKIPFLIRRFYKENPITFVLTAGENKTIFEIDFYKKTVRLLTEVSDQKNPIQILTSVFVFKQCITLELFASLPISKRAVYRVTKEKKKYIDIFELVFDFVDYDLLPMSRLLRWRNIVHWGQRWREILTYARIATNIFILKKSFDYKEYL